MENKQRNVIFVTLCTTCVALALLSTALNTALAPMVADLGVSVSTGQWIISGYALAMAVIMPLTAFLVTRFPTRRLYLAAVSIYLACTVACALGTSFAFIMSARVVQAMANGLIANLTQVTILSIFTQGERGSRMGWFGLATGVAPVIAPALGGIIVDVASWQAVFWCIAAVLVVALVAAVIVMRDVLDTKPKRLDVPSFAMSVIAFGGITLGLGQIAGSGLTAPITFVPLAAGAVAAVFFARRQLRSSDSFLELRVFCCKPYLVSVVGSCALYAVMMGSAAVLPLYMQGTLGTSASVAGLAVLPGAALMAAVNPLAGKIFDRRGIRVLAAAGGALLLLSNVCMCVPALNGSVAVLTAATVVRYAGIGLVQMPLVTWGNSALDKPMMVHGTALLTSFRNAFGAIGVAVFVGLLGVFGVAVAYGAMAVVALLVMAIAFARQR